MSSLGVFEGDLWTKGKTFTHPVNILNKLTKNMIRIDFIHAHKLTYDVLSAQVKFAGAYANTIASLKQTVLPAMTSIVVNVKLKGQSRSLLDLHGQHLGTKDTYGTRNTIHSVCRQIQELQNFHQKLHTL
jgi:hypothetical protein